MKLTEHSIKRAKERFKWKEPTLRRMASRALENGVKHSQTKGQLRQYLDKLFLTHGTANNMRIRGEKVYIFSGETLITVLWLPNNLKNHIKTIKQ